MENDKIQNTDTTIIKTGNSGGYLLPNWKFICNDKNKNGKLTYFIRSSKTKFPTGDSGETSLPPIGDIFMYMETSSDNHGEDVFVSFGQTGNIQITNITFNHNRFSILTNNCLKSMARFRI